MTAADGPRGSISSFAAHSLALWLGVLLPIATAVQLTYSVSAVSKRPQSVVAGAAYFMLVMITLGIRAATAIWRGHKDAAIFSEQALVAIVGANMLSCAPLSILVGTPPYFLPVVLITLLFFVVSDDWISGAARHD